MVASVGGLGGLGWLGRFQVALQAGKGLLGGRKIAGLQIAGQILIIRVCLAVFAKWLTGQGIGVVLQGFLEVGQGGLGGGEIARLQRAANGAEIPGDLLKPGLGCVLLGLIHVRG